MVRRAGRGIPAEGAADRGQGTGQRRGGRRDVLARPDRRPRRGGEHRALRRERAVPGAVRAVRLHAGPCGDGGPRVARPGRRDHRYHHGQLRRGKAMTDRLAELSAAGVAVWLDDISRQRLATGGLDALRREKHVVGVTSNPTIFAKAVSDRDDYAEQVRELALRKVGIDEATRMITT